ncbi:MAG: hypothetical protein WAW17_32680 [Rhodococcus sp. (in: high G+C Gram-positive bacteria)]|uniref:hypothetical protein n=1 Tax=Rhodococcus sp. TaxID=1831 RepID=UPI003BB18380
MNTTRKAGTRGLLFEAMVAGALATFPAGLVVALPSVTAPVASAEPSWQEQCDPDNNWRMELDRQNQQGECDDDRGQRERDRDQDQERGSPIDERGPGPFGSS